ncbi:MAG TPA: hypothetical protein VMG12_41750 [Polyangiaceae bacterium]|nr:hypothetical protein [Polyangiaceae bacterium]
MQPAYLLFGTALLALAACDGQSEPPATIGGGGNNNGGASTGGSSGGPSGGSGPMSGGGNGGYIDFGDAGSCPRTTCAELGWACGYTVDMCGNVVDCEQEGLTCGPNQVCVGGIDGPTVCAAGADPTCQLCTSVPDCGSGAQLTRLTGRVITPGRDDANVANQVGVPNAVVYIMKTDQIADLPAISAGTPTGGLSCDRCEEQDLGPLLAGAITDASGNFAIEGNVPVGVEFLLVVKAGKFRRVVRHTLPAEAACQTTALPTALPDNPTRLPRTMADGDAVNIPKIAVTTGRIDAIECVFEKMGVASTEFGNPESAARLHLYRSKATNGTPEGARIDDDTPNDIALYGSLDRMQSYDMVVSDCEGGSWDGANGAFAERVANGDKVREYVNRGGRLFASHLSMSWLHQNGSAEWSEADPISTGLAAASTWDVAYTATGNLDDSGTGVVSLVGTRQRVSPRIDGFASWLVNEGVTTAPDYQFALNDPRSLSSGLGPVSEEFVYRSDGNQRVQQFSFDTPYAAPDGAACGRVAYSGFHVAGNYPNSTPFANAQFPAHCRDTLANSGNLTNQEKVLLYMLFDLGACVGDEPVPPPCIPITCNGASGRRCGFTPDGCGQVLDCGPCRPPA